MGLHILSTMSTSGTCFVHERIRIEIFECREHLHFWQNFNFHFSPHFNMHHFKGGQNYLLGVLSTKFDCFMHVLEFQSQILFAEGNSCVAGLQNNIEKYFMPREPQIFDTILHKETTQYHHPILQISEANNNPTLSPLLSTMS